MPVRGWTLPQGSRLRHFIVDQTSLCRRWTVVGNFRGAIPFKKGCCRGCINRVFQLYRLRQTAASNLPV